MYVSLSSPGVELFGVDKTVSSSCGASKAVSVSARSLFLLDILSAVCLVVVFLEQI